MNQIGRSILIFVIGLVVGSILLKWIQMLYFVGCILFFIILMGNNRVALQNIGKNQPNQNSGQQLLWGMLGYIVAGIMFIFI
ncbi:hypothetical protein KBI51_06445 [Aerococcaceae bacterium zg-ZUI334]|uniref:hypothetical protein n=1 Tax=Aerococcaceae bacterium zg-252 TaxID=2796928 RepID=UPI001BA02CE2|nr:hypothetical protein [Aerococcaceae bacterium zg-ZUI334]